MRAFPPRLTAGCSPCAPRLLGVPLERQLRGGFPGGVVRWVQGYRNSDGSWSSDFDAAGQLGEFGGYEVTLWATFGGRTLAVGSAHAFVAEFDARVSASFDGGVLSHARRGLLGVPLERQLRGGFPGGVVRWVQGYRNSDGSWSGVVDYSRAGTYRVSIWATYGPSTEEWGLTSVGFHDATSYSIMGASM